ncbi:MAG TPA: methyltransferase domain-containing protein [Mycobacteriales bacterium]|nr:methyltransferase domain-containing protein [Mycobacteriales bacterium]
MPPRRRLAEPQVSPAEYDEDYYRTACAGHAEWDQSGGAAAAAIYPSVLARSGLQKGMTVLDVGAGRGELVAIAAEQGARWAVGVEYAPAAAALSRETIAARGVTDRARVVLADARELPLPDGCVDRAYLLDVIEHLAPAELDATLAEVHRVLRPGGRLHAHTFPTRTIYDVTYRMLRATSRGRRQSWPADPRNDYEHRMHVNEQTRRGLRQALRRSGFRRPTVRYGQWVYVDHLPSERVQALVRRLAGHRVAAPLAVADLWVEATR